MIVLIAAGDDLSALTGPAVACVCRPFPSGESIEGKAVVSRAEPGFMNRHDHGHLHWEQIGGARPQMVHLIHERIIAERTPRIVCISVD